MNSCSSSSYCSDNSSTDKSIFITQDEIKRSNLLETYTSVINTIPKGATTERNNEWRKDKLMEFRWRFLELPEKKVIAEISYLNYDEDIRTYFNKCGKWVKRVISPLYDQFVKEEYYYYSNK